jgi:hypothetical protein
MATFNWVGGSITFTEAALHRLPVLLDMVVVEGNHEVELGDVDSEAVRFISHVNNFAHTEPEDYVLPEEGAELVCEALRFYGVPETEVAALRTVRELRERLDFTRGLVKELVFRLPIKERENYLFSYLQNHID